MDVPPWHPANVDSTAPRNAAAAATASQRTEFKVMPGSCPDTSTEAGRQLLDELAHGDDGGGAAYEGRGFFDTSDRLYLLEQKQLALQRQNEQRAAEEQELRRFRSNALKIQAKQQQEQQKALEAAAAAPSISTSTTMPTIVIVKPKKRDAATQLENRKEKLKKITNKKAAQAKTIIQSTTTTSSASTVTTKPSLLIDYSCSSSEDEADAS